MNKKTAKPKKMSYAELEHYAKRLQADFENFKKRAQIERIDFAQYANMDLILQILPVLDNFRLAVKHLPPELAENGWVAGVRHIETQLEQTLESAGVGAIPALGQSFDHNYHEAIEEVRSDKPPGQIVEEVQKGYQLNGKVIRPAKVKVAANEQKLEAGEKTTKSING